MSEELSQFKIIPVLGRKTNVIASDESLFKFIRENVALTHDVGGLNYDITTKTNACTKAKGYKQWSYSANAQATKCLGLYELSVAGTRDHIFFDNGKCYIFSSALVPVVKEDAGGTTFATSNVDLYSMCTVGAYMVFADRAEHAPQKWKHGDTYITPLMYDGNSGGSGTEYKFRYVLPFQRRVLGLYSDQTNGDIDIRWSSSWPGTAITALNYPSANQLYIPNDDSITGGATMGHDRCYIYCENSIQQLVYYPDYSTPFRCYTIVQKQGCEGHHSIVNLGDRHYLFNRNYGFCEYRGGNMFPYGGKAISDDIEDVIQGISADYYNLIVGTFIPLTKEIVWTVPLNSSSTPTHLLFYNIESGQWRIEDKAMRYVDEWRLVEDYTWSDLITDAGGTGSDWTGVSSNPWAYYASVYQRLVYANTNGHLYNRDGDDLAGADIDGYRIEPAMHFGSEFEKKFLQEIWFAIARSGDFNIYVYHRSGDTMGELIDESWTSLGELSCNDNSRPVLHCGKTARLHQIKWGTDAKDERFRITEIAFRYKIGGNI